MIDLHALTPVLRDDWRANLLRITLRFAAVLGVPVYIPSVWIAAHEGNRVIVIGDTVALVAILTLCALAHRIHFRTRALCFIAIAHGLGTLLAVQVGPVAQVYLLGASLFTTLLLGRNAGLWHAGLSASTLVALGAIDQLEAGLIPFPVLQPLLASLVLSANFLLVNLLLVLALSTVIQHLERKLTEERALRTQLEASSSAAALAHQALHTSEERLRTISTHIREVFFTLDLDANLVTFVNEASDRIWGIPAEDLLTNRRRVWHVTHPDDRQVVLDARKAVTDGESPQIHYRIITPAGEERVIRERSWPIPSADGRIREAIGAADDVTDLDQLQREQQILESRLQEAQKMEALARLAGGIAHDVNNMLSVVIGYAALLEENLGPDHPHVTDVGLILQAADRSSEFMRHLLAFARRQHAQPRSLCIDDAIAEALDVYRRLAGPTLDLHWGPGAEGVCAHIDPAQLDQLLINLITNARTAAQGRSQLWIRTRTHDRPGGDRIPPSVTARPGEDRNPPSGTDLLIEVEDDGPGMPKEVLDRAFEPYFTTRPDDGGTGLGLPTVHGIVLQNEGRIEVVSAPGKGTRFRIWLPTSEGPADSRPQPQKLRNADAAGKATILVVEDEPALLRLTVEVLRKQGYHVLGAMDPHSALDVSAGYEGPIHLLVSDVMMPGMNGKELASALRASRPEILCLFVSGFSADTFSDSGEYGAPEVLDKPFTPGELLQRVAACLKRRGLAPPTDPS